MQGSYRIIFWVGGGEGLFKVHTPIETPRCLKCVLLWSGDREAIAVLTLILAAR